MKHLKKYNEDVESKFDKEYITNCFIELIDERKYDSEIEYYDDTFDIGFNCPDLDMNSEYDISEFIKYSNELVDFYKEIEDSINKVKIKYPNSTVFLDQDTFTVNHNDNNSHLMGKRYVWIRFRIN